MQQWTHGAQTALHDYLNDLRYRLGASPETEEILSDLESHVREAALRLKNSVVTAEEIEMILGTLGSPRAVAAERIAEERTSAPSGPANQLASRDLLGRCARVVEMPFKRIKRVKPGFWWRLFIYIFVVLFSVTAVVISLLSPDFMTEVAVNTFPTAIHAALCLLTVVCILLGYYAIKNPTRRGWSVGTFASGLAIGVSLFYLLVLIPIMPLLLLALFIGVGLIGLAPLWCLIAAIKHAVTFSTMCKTHKVGNRPLFVVLLLTGSLLPSLYLFGYEVRGLQMIETLEIAADSDGPAVVDAIRFLRKHGDQEVLRRRCYHISNRNRTSMLGYLLHFDSRLEISMNDYRAIYFRVYGEPFNTKPIKRMRMGLRTSVLWDDDWQADTVAGQEQGSDQVGGVVRRVRLKESLIDGTVHASEATAYLRWTMVFENKSARNREARMLLEIPDNAAPHQLSLWIDGEERHAAFGSTRQVREAYREVAVRQERDPALLTAKGRNRLMLQLFPIPPEGKMKVRIGMVVPLIERNGRQFLTLPRIIERNFSISEGKKHTVWFDWASDQTPSNVTKPWTVGKKSDDRYPFRATLTDKQLLAYSTSTLSMPSPIPGGGQWSIAADKRGSVSQYRARLAAGEGAPWAPGGPVVLVIDGSVTGPNKNAAWWEQILAAIPDGTPVSALLAADETIRWRDGLIPLNAGNRHELSVWLSNQEFVGGRDSVPALGEALDAAGLDNGGLVVWFHGTIPVLLSSPDALMHRWSKRSGWAKLIAFPMASVPNRVMEKIAVNGHGRIVPRLGRVRDDFKAALASLRFAPISPPAGVNPKQCSRLRSVGSDVGSLYLHAEPAKQAHVQKGSDDQLPILWAKARVEVLTRGGDFEAGRELAQTYQLITDQTGAVVLENRQQYDAAGLDPDATSMTQFHGIPEPSTVVLMALGLVAVAYGARRRRARQQPLVQKR